MKKILKKMFYFYIILTLVFGFSFVTANHKTQAATVKLSQSNIILNVGDHYKLTVKGIGEEDVVTWKSTKKAIASVDETGIVSPKKKGATTIQAKVNGKTYKCKVKVRSVYTISKKSPLKDVGSNKYSTYGSSFVNSYTRDWYLFRSYMEQIEKEGGGTLVVKKGTYNVTNTVCIPSNVNIILKKGTVINKTNNTHASFKAGVTLFEFVPAAKYNTKGWAKKYNGVSNCKVIGEGKNTINLNYQLYSVAFTLCHNKDIEISGINFKNVNESHFIELDAGKNIVIRDCSFTGQKGKNYNREAINLDIPDPTTSGFSKAWAKNDRTINNNITVENCSFNKLYTAVGSHWYSITPKKKQIHHKNINIINCTIKNTKKYGIHALNWENLVMKDCKLSNNKGYGVYGSGSIYPEITDNKFTSCKLGAIVIGHTTFGGNPTTFSKISKDFIEIAETTNTFKKCKVKVDAKE